MSTTEKHKAIIHLRIEVHDVLPTGECSGKPLKLNQYPEYGLKHSMLIAIDGYDRHDCLQKLKNKLEELAK
jgi:hypothetical protein